MRHLLEEDNFKFNRVVQGETESGSQSAYALTAPIE